MIDLIPRYRSTRRTTLVNNKWFTILEWRDMFKDSKYESSLLYLLENIMCANWCEWNGRQGLPNNQKYDHIYAMNYGRELTSSSNPNCYFGKWQCTLQNIYIIHFLKGNYHGVYVFSNREAMFKFFVPVQKYIELQNKYTHTQNLLCRSSDACVELTSKSRTIVLV